MVNKQVQDEGKKMNAMVKGNCFMLDIKKNIKIQLLLDKCQINAVIFSGYNAEFCLSDTQLYQFRASVYLSYNQH